MASSRSLDGVITEPIRESRRSEKSDGTNRCIAHCLHAMRRHTPRRSIHDMSEAEKRDVADELMLPTGAFAAVAFAAVIILALLWAPAGTFDHISRIAPVSIALNGR
jgi:hypothetical protein